MLPAISPETRFWIWIFTGMCGVLMTGLLAYTASYINHWIRHRISGEHQGGRAPGRPGFWVWLLLFLSALGFIIGTASASSLPETQGIDQSQVPYLLAAFTIVFVGIILTSLRRFRRLAYVFLALCILSGVALGITAYRKQLALEDKLVILIANFEGPEPQKYHLTEDLLAALQKEVTGYQEIVIVPLKVTITEQQGSDYARRLGHQRHADLVIWGWYSVTETDVKQTLHVENLNERELTPLESSKTQQTHLSVADLQSFKLHAQNNAQISALIIFLNGFIFYSSGDIPLALDRFNQALNHQSWAKDLINLETVYFYRGTSMFYLRFFEKAITDYDQVIRLDPQLATAFLNRGTTYMLLENYDLAITDFTQAIDLVPSFATAFNNRGFIYTNLKIYEQAITDFNKAIQLDPNDAIAFNNRGRVFIFLNQFDKAITDFNMAIQIDPQYAHAFNNRGIVYASRKQFDQAFSDINHAIDLDPQDADAYYNRGNVYNNLEQYEQAINDYTKAIQLNPKYTSAFINRSLIYWNLNQYEQALTDINRAIDLDPQDPLTFLNRGGIYSKLKKFDLSIADFSQAIDLDPQLTVAFNNRGLVHTDIKQYDLAIADFTEAIQIDPQYVNAFYNRGYVYAELKQFEHVVSDFTKVIRLDHNNVNAFCGRGQAYHILGQEDSAIADLNQCLKLCETSPSDICQQASDILQQLTRP